MTAQINHYNYVHWHIRY